MGRTAAPSQRASGANARRQRDRSSHEIPRTRPSGPDADGAATVRNVIPWRTVEKELQARLAAKAARSDSSSEVDSVSPDAIPSIRPSDSVPAAPDSGVRPSSSSFKGPTPAVGLGVLEVPAAEPEGAAPHRPLTYSMYTIAEIESREVQAQRLSLIMPQPPQVLGWNDVARSGVALLGAFAAWLKASPRPRLLDVCRVPLNAFLADLRAVLARLPWRKIAVGAGIAFGAFFFLLFAVITVAELTDDLKPATTSSSSTQARAVAAPAIAGEPAAPAAMQVAPAAAPEPAPIVELDDGPAKPKAIAAKAAPVVAKPKPKRPNIPERFIP